MVMGTSIIYVESHEKTLDVMMWPKSFGRGVCIVPDSHFILLRKLERGSMVILVS